MAEHVRPALRRRSGRTRMWLSLGLALGLGSVGTMALWSTTVTAVPGTVTAGQLDVLVNGVLSGQANRDGTTTMTWSVTNLLPGESQAYALPVSNGGVSTIPLDVRLSAYASGALGPALRVQVYRSGTPTNTGGSASTPLASHYRTGTCTGTAAGSAQAVGTSAATATVVDATKVPLTVGASTTYCVIVSMDSAATTYNTAAYRDAKATLSIVVRGTQRGAP